MCFMNKTSVFFYDMLLKMYKLASNRLPKKIKDKETCLNIHCKYTYANKQIVVKLEEISLSN